MAVSWFASIVSNLEFCNLCFGFRMLVDSLLLSFVTMSAMLMGWR